MRACQTMSVQPYRCLICGLGGAGVDLGMNKPVGGVNGRLYLCANCVGRAAGTLGDVITVAEHEKQLAGVKAAAEELIQREVDAKDREISTMAQQIDRAMAAREQAEAARVGSETALGTVRARLDAWERGLLPDDRAQEAAGELLAAGIAAATSKPAKRRTA